MKIGKTALSNKPMRFVNTEVYDNYVAIDWSLEKMSIGRMSSNSVSPIVERDLPGKVKVIISYLKDFKGKTILTIEESTGAQWLYVELKDYVDKIIICDPSRNHLLKEGPKNDPKDAGDLCMLLRAGMLKEVFHSNTENYNIRKLISSYDQLIKSGVRAQNQLSAIYRSYGLNHKKDKFDKKEVYLERILTEKSRAIGLYHDEKAEYHKLFSELKRKNKTIKNLCTISGIDKTLAVKIFGVVIDANRFSDKYKYFAYCGLVKYKRESGKTVKRKKNTLYSRVLKSVYKSAVLGALKGHNDIREYYEMMLKQGISSKLAQNIIARYIAKSTLAIMKNNTRYKPYSWRNKD